MSWDASRKSHEGLLAAGYTGPVETDEEHPPTCQFCKRELMWYLSPNNKFQPFDAGTFETHHGSCADYREHRQKIKKALAS